MGFEQGDEARGRAYEAGARIARQTMERDQPEQAAALGRVAEDIVVMRGCYDRVERVLHALGLPHTAVDPEEVARLRLRQEQLLVVNCPGEIGRRAASWSGSRAPAAASSRPTGPCGT